MKIRNTLLKTTAFAILGLTSAALSTRLQASGDTGDRNVAEYNLGETKVALKGFDPVAYFEEGGSAALVGSEELALEYKGVIYHFATQENQDLFLNKPEKYEATYGGWCAYAMAFNQKVDIDPALFVVNGNRLHLFISENAKAEFLKNVPGFERRADRNWKSISGEEARE